MQNTQLNLIGFFRAWVASPITSIYWWQGVIETAQEWVRLVKTHEDLYNKVEQAIQAMHSL